MICIDRAGIVGEDGATHQGVYDLSYLSFIPNLTIIAPATDRQLRDAMDWAIQQDEGPVVIRYPRGIAEISQTDVLEKNKPVVVKSNGKPAKITITGVGHSMKIAQMVYEKLRAEFPKKSICLLNPLFIKPYDKTIYDEIYQHSSYHFVIEENAKIGGFAAMLSIDYCLSDTKTIPFAIPDEFIQHGSIEKLREVLGFTADHINEQICNILRA
jgi:1-deoxy-D-xylulose-5-phosphate synthase